MPAGRLQTAAGGLLFIPDAVALGENIPYQLAYVSVPTISFQSLAPIHVERSAWDKHG